MKYYKTRSWGIKIEAVEVERVTDSFVWINGRKHAISSGHECYYKTWAGAKQSYINMYQDKIQQLERRLSEAKDELAQAEALTE